MTPTQTPHAAAAALRGINRLNACNNADDFKVAVKELVQDLIGTIEQVEREGRSDTDRLNLLESLCRQSEGVWLFNGYGSDLVLAEYTGQGDSPDHEELSKAPTLREAIDKLPKPPLMASERAGERVPPSQ